VIGDIERKVVVVDCELRELLELGGKIYRQERHDKNKVYRVHIFEVECVSKGKAHKRYEFGCKVSVAVTSRGGWILGAMAHRGNPYDGKRLEKILEQAQKMSPKPIRQAFVDLGYRGHDYRREIDVHICQRRRDKIAASLWKWMKRRRAVEPVIGHLKQEHKMGRNLLKGATGYRINDLLSVSGMNFLKL